jgi:hypothetical protein
VAVPDGYRVPASSQVIVWASAYGRAILPPVWARVMLVVAAIGAVLSGCGRQPTTGDAGSAGTGGSTTVGGTAGAG